MKSRPAVFLDRDGTLNVERSYLTRPEDLCLIVGAAEAVARLNDAGYPVVIITNQSAIARNLLSERVLGDIHCRLREKLLLSGASLDAIYYCPHHPDFRPQSTPSECGCRKPQPGLILQAARDLGLDLARSVMVGDSLSDLQAGWNAGCQSALVLTGHGEETRLKADANLKERVDLIAESLTDVAEWFCRSRPG